MNVEKELSLALVRREPPPGFRDRVLARIQERRLGEVPATAGLGWARTAAALLLVVSVGALSTTYFARVRQEAAGERAKRDLIVAMKIASEKTNLARQEVLALHGAEGELE